MNKLKKITRQRLFLPLFCMLLVLCVNMVYDVVQGNEFYNFLSSSKSESRTSCSAAVW